MLCRRVQLRCRTGRKGKHIRKEIYDSVTARWRQLGLPGQAPAVQAFEQEEKVVYHEEGGFEPGHEEREKKDK